MPRVICDLPNASDEINGVKFHPLTEGGMISDELSDDDAALFASIPGYALDDGESAKAAAPASAPPPATRKVKEKAEPAPKKEVKAEVVKAEEAKPAEVVTETAASDDAAGEKEIF